MNASSKPYVCVSLPFAFTIIETFKLITLPISIRYIWLSGVATRSAYHVCSVAASYWASFVKQNTEATAYNRRIWQMRRHRRFFDPIQRQRSYIYTFEIIKLES